MTESRHAPLALHPLDAGTADEPGERLRRSQVLRRTKALALLVLLLLAVGAAHTLWNRRANARALEAGTAERATTYVKTGTPTALRGGGTLTLPGTLQGAAQSPIAARTGGYLKRWTQDIGTHVAAGALLAEIDAPEIDQQLSQAMAARELAAASLDLARLTAERWEALRRKDLVSQQELEERRSNAAQARANLAAADANAQRLRQLEGFKRVVAPFSGVITRRNVEVGDLVDPGAGRPLFVLTRADALRLMVNVPQASAQLVRPGQPVSVTMAEIPGQRFEGRIARSAGALDPTTRTLPLEIVLPNPDGRLLPGAFVSVHVPLASAGGLGVPSNALLLRAEGPRVALVDAQGRVSLRAVSLGRNLGESVEVLAGLAPGDRFVLNPSDSLADGSRVNAAPAPTAATAASTR